jgi:hypothetical protein
LVLHASLLELQLLHLAEKLAQRLLQLTKPYLNLGGRCPLGQLDWDAKHVAKGFHLRLSGSQPRNEICVLSLRCKRQPRHHASEHAG